jgi:hypothetical protein
MPFPQERSTPHGHPIVVDEIDDGIVFLYEHMEVARLAPNDEGSWELRYPESSYPSILVGGGDDDSRISNALFQISAKLTREQTEARGGE